ncbi:UNVERIFIED_CONTAM: hypothetical protein RMT77_016981 [Armadillidium vulgare]
MVSRLEDLCGIQMAIELASKLQVKKEILRLPDLHLYESSWYFRNKLWFEYMEKKVLYEMKKLPFVLREEIPIPLVIFCLTQSIEWAKFHKKEFDLPFDYSCSFVRRSSFFTSKGILSKEKAARELLKDTELSPSLKFCIACHYCLSDVIPVLWEQLPEDKKPKIENGVLCNGFCIGERNKMADLWSYSLLGELQFIMEKTSDSFSLYKFKKSLEYNGLRRDCGDVAFKKCFEELNETEKEEALIFTRNKSRYSICDIGSFGRHKRNLFPLQAFLPFQKYIEMVIFLLRHLDERQLMVFFEPVLLHYILFHLLIWPYQHLFMDVVSQFWEVLPKTGFCLLFYRIVSLMKNKSYCKLCNYHNIFNDFWTQSSPSLKRIFFRLEGTNRDILRVFPYEERVNYFKHFLASAFEQLRFSYVICDLFDSPFTFEDEKIIRLIFSSATLEEKSDIVRLQGNRIGKISFDACNLRRIDLFIECCVPKERIESFKKELFNDEDVKKVLFSLVLDNKGKAFQKILNWAFSAEEIKEWLKNFLLYMRQDRIPNLYSCKKIKFIDKSLEWALSSNEIQNFKESVISHMRDIWLHSESLLSGDFEDIDLLLEWIFSSKIEMVKFKRDLAFDSIDYMGSSFPRNGLNSFKELIKWSSLSKEESKDFKRKVAFSEKIIEYYSKFVAQRQLYKADTFIGFAELTEMEVKNFKRLLVFNIEGKIFSSCVSFILNGKRDFVQKLVNWTQFSKEEVRKFYSLLPEELNLYIQITKENTKLNDIKEFFNGFPLSEEEIKRHKKDFLFKSINLIEYFVMENRWDEMEELLGWCFSSKREMSDFKKKIPLKINNICLNLISCQRFDDVDKFFTWTGVHNSLKKKLLKKIIFDSRVYEIVLWMDNSSNKKMDGLLTFLSSNDLLSDKWKESVLIWYYEHEKRSDCSDVNCLKIKRPDIRGFGVHLDYHRLCDGCRSFIENCKRFIKLVDEHNNILKVRPKRKLESSRQINSTEAKRSRHC